ncbi:hypothetical protein CLOL250_02079 [Clostridium sp. L2-50]|nr:hypothetical protein CLOL250_02079 [Clostridium sp. L2-50]
MLLYASNLCYYIYIIYSQKPEYMQKHRLLIISVTDIARLMADKMITRRDERDEM